MKPVLCVPAGPVDATFKAIDSLVQVEAQLVDYSAQSLWDGSQAPVTARVSIQPTGRAADLAAQARGSDAKPLQFSGRHSSCWGRKGRAYLLLLVVVVGKATSCGCACQVMHTHGCVHAAACRWPV